MKNLRDIASSRKEVATFFIISYLVLTIMLLTGIFILAVKAIEMPDWAIGIISAIWGAYTTVASQIMSYYFGDSAQTGENNETLRQSIDNTKQANKAGINIPAPVILDPRENMPDFDILRGQVDDYHGGGDESKIIEKNGD